MKQIFAGTVQEKISNGQKMYWKKEGISAINKIDQLRELREKQYREAYSIWKEQHPENNINDITRSVEIPIKSGVKIKLGARLHNMKQKMLGKGDGIVTEEQRTFWFVQEGLTLENEIDMQTAKSEKERREAFEIWLQDNPSKTANDIPKGTNITISNGKVIALYNSISGLKNTIKKKILGEKASYKIDEEKIEYWIYKHKLRINGILLEKDFDKEKIRKRILCLEELKKQRRQKKNNEHRDFNLTENVDINESKLNRYLCRKKNKLDKTQILMRGNETLKTYCFKHGYNYDVIYRMIRDRNITDYASLDDLIEKMIELYESNGQKNPSKWVYNKDGVLFKHVLLFVGVDSVNIIRNINKNKIGLEEAIGYEIFRNNINDKAYLWIEALYNKLIELIITNKDINNLESILADKFSDLVKEYELDKEEYSALKNVLYKYIEAVKKYKMADVGLCQDEEEKKRKIIEYNLDKYEIEESLIIELNFYNGIILRHNSQIYKRRQLLRHYILTWNRFTDEEKQKIIDENCFSSDELEYIIRKREGIDNIISTVAKTDEPYSATYKKS